MNDRIERLGRGEFTSINWMKKGSETLDKLSFKWLKSKLGKLLLLFSALFACTHATIASESLSIPTILHDHQLNSLIKEQLQNVSHDRHISIYISGDGIKNNLPSPVAEGSPASLTVLLLNQASHLRGGIEEPDDLVSFNLAEGKNAITLPLNGQHSFTSLTSRLLASGVSPSRLPTRFSKNLAVSYMSVTNGRPVWVPDSSSCTSQFVLSNPETINDGVNHVFTCYLLNVIVPLEKVSDGLIEHSYFVNFEVQIVGRSKPTYLSDEVWDFDEHWDSITSKIIDSSIIVEGINPVQGTFPALSKDSLLLTYNPVGNNLEHQVIKGRFIDSEKLISVGSEHDLSWFFGNAQVSFNNSVASKNYKSFTMLHSPLRFQNTWPLNHNEPFRCKKLFWLENSKGFECLVSSKNNYWLTVNQKNQNKIRLSNQTLSYDENHLRRWIEPPLVKGITETPWVMFHMSPAIMPSVNQYSEYNIPNGGIGLGDSAATYCNFYPVAWNRFSKKNNNLKSQEKVGGFVRFNFNESLSMTSKECVLSDFNSENFVYRMAYKLNGHPKGMYTLFHNNDLLIRYFENNEIKQVVVSIGWGENKVVEVFDYPSNLPSANIWSNLEVRLFDNVLTTSINGILLGKEKVPLSFSLKLNENMTIGMKWTSNASPISMDIAHVEITQLPERSSLQNCFDDDSEASINILTIGDSITESKTSYGGTWRQDICNLAHGSNEGVDMIGSKSFYLDTQSSTNGLLYDFDGDHEGYSGATTQTIHSLVSDEQLSQADIILLHSGTNDIRQECNQGRCVRDGVLQLSQTYQYLVNPQKNIWRTTNAELASTYIIRFTETIATRAISQNPNVKLYISKIIPPNTAHISENDAIESGRAAFTSDISLFYQYHFQRLETWARVYNSKIGRRAVRIVDHHSAFLKNLNGINLDENFVENFYNDKLHPKGPISEGELDFTNVYGTEVIADSWYRTLLSY